ncbi:uncharacterized protein LOC123679740 [Harmonia axyridis]|uniref:uncharacterized protein LOC123679740 n=1 Tax=Harmonia axyridis TaxID=115357 RepID=UPI001E275520|nr:uncharacterized protein LOC123679740 [Harmonia axyridis]
MNTRVLRRSSRRHSISTLPNIENRYSKKELSLDVGCALDELRVLNTQTINKRRSSARGLSRNNEYSIYQKEKLQINSSNGIQNEELVKSCPPTVSKSIYDSLMDIEKVLDDIAIPDQRRRSRRISEIEKQRVYSYNTPKNTECRVSIKNQRKSKNSNEVLVAEPILERRKRKRCEESTSTSIENLCGSKENTEKINEKPYPRKMRKKSVSKNCIILDEIEKAKQIENYYLNKTSHNTKTSLETIYEENNVGLENIMEKRKIKRLIPFEEINKNKSKTSSECLEKLNPRKKKSIDVALANLSDEVDI